MSSPTGFTTPLGTHSHFKCSARPDYAIDFGDELTMLSYSDDKFEYRHVQLPKAMLKQIPKDYFDSSKGTLKLLWEEEWRNLGITQVR